MLLTRKQILDMHAALGKLPPVKDVRLAFTLAKNKMNVLAPVVEAILDTHKPSNEFNSYQEERLQLCKQYCVKDSIGAPKIENGQYVMPEERSEFDGKFVLLKEKYAEAIEEAENKNKNFEDFLKETEDLDLKMVTLEALTAGLEGEKVDLTGILPIIEE